VGTRREETGIRWKERKEGAECAMRREIERETIEHMWNGCSERRKERKRRNKHVNFWNRYFYIYTGCY
jgi:hypothetical protein